MTLGIWVLIVSNLILLWRCRAQEWTQKRLERELDRVYDEQAVLMGEMQQAKITGEVVVVYDATHVSMN